MEKAIEQLRKEAQPIVDKCVGKRFTDAEVEFLDAKNPICSRIDPVITVDENGNEKISFTDDACRCTAYAFPEAKWRVGSCPLATHYNPAEEENAGKVRVGQQKQKKKK